MLWKKSLAIFVALGGQLAAAAFNKVTAETAWTAMEPGWNVGNTLDAVPDETSWGHRNTPVSQSLLDSIKATGIKSVRIPVTWTDHFATQSPEYLVNTTWMDRVEQVVDWALERQLWVVINVHHDSWQWADLSVDTDLNAKFAKLEALWTQIAARFKWKSEKLLFETLNEPVGSTQEHADRYNDLNQRFVNIVRGSGGYNADRLLTLPGLNCNIQNTVNWFVVPANATPWILHVHDYDPWSFVATSWGQTFWGTDDDKSAIEATFIALQDQFAAPVLLGEWGTGGNGVEKGSSWIYFDYFARTTKAYNLTAQLWDNGEHFDRVAMKWRDPTQEAVMFNAVKGITNTLPSYNQPASIYSKINAAVVSQDIALDFNNNTILSVVNAGGKTLARGQEYAVTATGITIPATYLSTVFTGSLGIKDTLTVKSNHGVDLPFDVILYDAPTLSQNSYTLSTAANDLYIPFDGKGSTLATVQAVCADGTFLKDTWTQWLGPLQQGRINWGDFGVSGNNIVLYAALLAYVQTAAQPVTFTFEFWPRTVPNNVTAAVTISS
ncbi:glycoside hydrolase superfamily [Sphaerosporella brunnea]|uniref:Glycoside hydrolase superfamily n=1 Tax=Sphaerosporella brunnea TaxID=1250544 RepID=A0A5J5F3G1_9PEZI|nr:glycoside hydrolase superfamily [Sphaerosporella brunnea]